MVAIIAVSAVVVIGAVAYVVGNASDAKFMFLVAVLAVGFGSGFGAFTLGFMLGYLQDSPAGQQKLGRLEDQMADLKRANANLRKTIGDMASGGQAPLMAPPQARPAAVEPPPEEFDRPLVATANGGGVESSRVVISLTPFLNSLNLRSLLPSRAGTQVAAQNLLPEKGLE